MTSSKPRIKLACVYMAIKTLDYQRMLAPVRPIHNLLHMYLLFVQLNKGMTLPKQVGSAQS